MRKVEQKGVPEIDCRARQPPKAGGLALHYEQTGAQAAAWPRPMRQPTWVALRPTAGHSGGKRSPRRQAVANISAGDCSREDAPAKRVAQTGMEGSFRNGQHGRWAQNACPSRACPANRRAQGSTCAMTCPASTPGAGEPQNTCCRSSGCRARQGRGSGCGTMAGRSPHDPHCCLLRVHASECGQQADAAAYCSVGSKPPSRAPSRARPPPRSSVGLRPGGSAPPAPPACPMRPAPQPGWRPCHRCHLHPACTPGFPPACTADDAHAAGQPAGCAP